MNLFLIIGIVAAFTTTSIFGSLVTSASAQGNMNMTMDNMTAPSMDNMSSMNMTMDNDSVVIGESHVAPPQVTASQVGEGSDSGEDEN